MVWMSHHAFLSLYVCTDILYYIGCHYFPFNWTAFCLAQAYWTLHQPCINFMHGFLICVTIKADLQRARCNTWLCVYWINQNKKRKPFNTLKLILSKLQMHPKCLQRSYNDKWSTNMFMKHLIAKSNRPARTICFIILTSSLKCKLCICFHFPVQ